jgi:hypothetical protein
MLIFDETGIVVLEVARQGGNQTDQGRIAACPKGVKAAK